MALLNTIDVEDVTRKLRDWLGTRLSGEAEYLTVGNVAIPHAAGFSMTTILFDAKWVDNDSQDQVVHLVCRVAPATPGLLEHADLAKEFSLLRALNESTEIKVPTVRWLEEDSSVLGAPFVVMDRIYGEIPSDDPPYVVEGWVLELDPSRRGDLYENALLVMAQIHDVDWRGLGLGYLCDPGFGELGLGHQITELEGFYAWVHGGAPSSTIDAAFDWIKENRPSDDELVLNWGDPRIANLIFDPESLQVDGVLDWEMATIASPEMDLGWLLMFVRYNSEGIGVELPEGLQTRSELISRYEQIAGRLVKHIDYYETLAALRASIFLMRIGRLMIAAGVLPPDNQMPFNNPMSQMLAKLAGLPAPAGESSNFVGNR